MFGGTLLSWRKKYLRLVFTCFFFFSFFLFFLSQGLIPDSTDWWFRLIKHSTNLTKYYHNQATIAKMNFNLFMYRTRLYFVPFTKKKKK